MVMADYEGFAATMRGAFPPVHAQTEASHDELIYLPQGSIGILVNLPAADDVPGIQISVSVVERTTVQEVTALARAIAAQLKGVIELD